MHFLAARITGNFFFVFFFCFLQVTVIRILIVVALYILLPSAEK